MNKLSRISLTIGVVGLLSFFLMHVLIYTELIESAPDVCGNQCHQEDEIIKVLGKLLRVCLVFGKILILH